MRVRLQRAFALLQMGVQLCRLPAKLSLRNSVLLCSVRALQLAMRAGQHAELAAGTRSMRQRLAALNAEAAAREARNQQLQASLMEPRVVCRVKTPTQLL